MPSCKCIVKKLKYKGAITDSEYEKLMRNLSAAELSALDQIRWERDIAIAQLSEIGKGFGEQMDDVVKVKHGKWERHYSRPNVFADLYWHCSACGYKNDNQWANVYHLYCPNCGADMRKETEDEQS